MLNKSTIIPSMLLIGGISLSTWVHWQESTAPPIQHIDTFIPEDHVLIPIDFTNSLLLADFSGSTIRADIYQEGKVLLRQSRIIRSPKNANLYAVLVHESRAKPIVKAKGPFRVSLRNPNRPSKQREKNKSKRKNRIQYGEPN